VNKKKRKNRQKQQKNQENGMEKADTTLPYHLRRTANRYASKSKRTRIRYTKHPNDKQSLKTDRNPKTTLKEEEKGKATTN
jgi:hypothetical protein